METSRLLDQYLYIFKRATDFHLKAARLKKSETLYGAVASRCFTYIPRQNSSALPLQRLYLAKRDANGFSSLSRRGVGRRPPPK